MSIASQRSRVAFIDLAKGICIILVVFAHLESHAGISLWIDDYFRMFRMPLYFFLSGLFFKEYGGFVDFVKRKTNKLLIPFIFFFLLTSVGIPLMISLIHNNPFDWSTLYSFIDDEDMYNPPIWFLWCLFIINCIFYFINSIARSLSDRRQGLIVCVISACLGVCGYWLGHTGTNIPSYVDTSLTAMPFFAAGRVVYRNTDFLYPNKYDKYNWLFAIGFLILLIISKGGQIDYRSNTMQASIWSVYLGGFAGLSVILLLSKMINKLPLVSYYGKYSIIILVTHMVLIHVLFWAYKHIINTTSTLLVLTFFSVILSYTMIIPLMIKYMGHVTAQKDIIKID